MDKRCHIFFSGTVQGVGFRFTSRYLANKHNIKGWVRNLIDGRVELEVEGDSKEIDNFLTDLKNDFKGYISDFNLEELPICVEYSDFKVKA